MKKQHLSINEKRDWLAGLFRDESGEVSQAEKFKAMVEDTRLAMLNDDKKAEPPDGKLQLGELFKSLPPALKK